MGVADGRIIEIDLDRGGVREVGTLDAYSDVLGGRGLSQALLAERIAPGIGPFDPECPVVFGAGLLCGTDAPGAARLSIDSVNPFTGGIGSSNVGGGAASALRRAGIAGLVLVGQARSTVVIEVEDGRIEVRPAADLAGGRIPEVDRALRERRPPGTSSILIGPAGERGAWPAAVIVDGARAAGRCGLGAVLGAKRVKGLVVRGTGVLRVAAPEPFGQAVAAARRKLEQSPFNQRRMRYGVYCYETPWEIESPYRNFSGDRIPPEKIERLHPDRFLPYLVDRTGCDACPIRCWTTHEFVGPDGIERRCEALQGNDPDNFGARLDLDDPREILQAHALCTELGLDVDGTSAVIAWAIDVRAAGLLRRSDCDGRDLVWGDAGLVFDLIEAIADRTGLGDRLAEGSARAAARLGRGSERFSHHVRGNDLFECLWMSPAWAFGTVLSPRGGTHTRGAVLEDRIRDLPPDLALRWYGRETLPSPGSWEDVERMVIHQERVSAAFDALGLCLFTSSGRPDMLLPGEIAKWVTAALGRTVSEDGLLEIGERIHVQERSINRSLGLPGRAGDRPPRHFVDVPLDGRYRIDPTAWEAALDRYYALRGWDPATGWPTAETLARLGLSEPWRRTEGGATSE